MSYRRYEFECPKCGHLFLHTTPDAGPCHNQTCKAEYMQLLSVLQIAENAGVFNGYPIKIKIDKYLDK
jgi:hypothetical protein